MIDRQLSEHFRLSEFLRSQTAARRGIDMTPPPDVVANLERLCVTLLEPVRAMLKTTMFVSSGYRPQELNRLIGGVPTSAHISGRAADIVFAGIDPALAAHQLKPQVPGALDQAIDEYGQWLHLAISTLGDEPRWQFLLAARDIDGKTVYTNF